MKPDPNSPSFYLHDENNFEADADNGNADVDSKSPPSFSSSPRRFSPEEDGMDVGGGSDEEQSANTSRQGSKRTLQEREESEEQEDLLSSTEPVTKKRRTQEPAAQANNATTSNTTVSQSSEAREYRNLQQLVNWTCEHLLEMNHGRAFRIGDVFTYNTFAQFRNALEKATQSNAPELVEKLFATGMQNCVPEALENALAIANSLGAHDVIALLNQHHNASSSSSMSFNSSSSATSASTSSSSTTTASASANCLSTTVVPLSGFEAGWQKKVRLDLSDEALKEILDNLTIPEFLPRLSTLLFGNDFPLNGGYVVQLIPQATQNMLLVLKACGAVCLANHSNLVIKSSDFDRDKFLAGLLAIQEIERVAAENLAEGTPNSLFSALMLAALLGDLEIVRTLLDNGAIPIAVDHNNKNALMFAAEFGHLEIVRLLLPSGINVNAVTDEGDGIRETALSYAADKGHYAVCQLLLQSGARLDIVSSSMPLHKAAEHGDAELCRLFIQHGADINQINSCDETPLFCAVDNQQLTICKLLLNSGAEINTFVGEGQTILGVAAFGGNTELVEYLLSQGAQVDGLEDITIGLKKGLTPLMHAAIKDYPAIVEILLDRGALINITTFEGNSALWFACHNFSQGAATLLLQRGADPNLINRYGSSIIETTAKSGNDEIVKLLIQHGVALFSQRNKGYQALEIAVEEGHVSMAQLLLAANVPAEMIVDQHATSLLILAMQSLSGNTLLEMLTLLLQQNISLRKTDDEGNDALMLSVHTTGFHVMSMLIKHGALIGQVNKYGQNALAIAIDAIDALDLSVQIDRLKMMYAFTKLVNLLNQAQKQPNWLALRKDALNRAQHALTREIILVSWAWPHVGNGLLIVDLAKININVGALHDFIQFVINSPCAISREKIVYMLGMAGLCPPLIDLVGPYIGALHQFKSLLFGHSATGHDKAISAFIAGLAAPLEKIHLPLGLHWTPYIIELSNMPAGTALNQIANAELDSLMAMSLAIESEHTATVFKTLFETCFNLSFTEKSLPATFPAYAAASGALADALMAKSVYSALATKIESAWKTAWAKFEGKEMSSAPSTTSSSTSSASATSLGIDSDDPFGLFSVDDLPATGMDKISMSTLTAFFSESPQGQALLKEFRTQLLLAIDDAQENILHAPNVTDEAAQIYAELMLRQVNMLKRLFL